MNDNLQGQEALKKIKELAESVGICMFTTLHDGRMYGRPMGTSAIDDDGTFWFFTSDDTTVAEDAGGDHVCLNYSSPAKNTYLTVQGKAELVHDKAKMEDLWKDILKAWFPDGLETPGIALIRVTPDEAHYWDADASRMRILLQYAYAATTGNYKSMEGKEGELKLS